MLNHDQVACQYKQKAKSRRSRFKTCLPLLTLTESFMIVLVPTRLQYSAGRRQKEITLRDSLQKFITLHKARFGISLRLVQNTVRNYLHGLQNSGESIEDSDLHADFGPVTW